MTSSNDSGAVSRAGKMAAVTLALVTSDMTSSSSADNWTVCDDCDVNATTVNTTTVAIGGSESYSGWQMVLIATVCSLIMVGTIVGNLLVCTAVAIVRRLRTPSNLLIVSLAVSDLLVAVLDMPFATAYEVRTLSFWFRVTVRPSSVCHGVPCT
jgi:hypothetical protein